MSSPNPQFTGEANAAIEHAFYRLLHQAILRAAVIHEKDEVSPLDAACVAYAKAAPLAVRQMIARKAAEK